MALKDGLVKFVSCTAAQFHAIGFTPVETTLYFVTDEHRLYKGATPYSGGVYKSVTSLPSTLDINTLYLLPTGQVVFYDGAAQHELVPAHEASLTETGSNVVPTSKAVADYVANKISGLSVGNLESRVSAVETKASDNENAIGVINGTGAGSISKAAADAKADAIAAAATDATTKASAAQAAAEAKVTELADGAVATNTAAIATLNGEGAGSVKKAVSDAKSALETEIAKKANSATTLAGYGIGDAYTKAEADSAISTAVANAHHLKREVVESLPEVAEANADTIYMVPKKTGAAGNAEGNSYVEYMLINGKFEQIGDSTVDLTDYAKTADVESKITSAVKVETDRAKDVEGGLDTRIQALETSVGDGGSVADKIATAKSEAIAAAAADAKTKADNAEKNAKAYADGLASNYATAAQGEKADSALQAADIKTGVAGVGTISVKGTDVAVHGLGDIASHAVSEFATAAQGEKADSAVQSVVEGTDNGTILVDSKSVSVHGLGSAAFTAASAYDKSGAATAAQTAAEKHADEAVAGLKADIEAALTWGTL